MHGKRTTTHINYQSASPAPLRIRKEMYDHEAAKITTSCQRLIGFIWQKKLSFFKGTRTSTLQTGRASRIMTRPQFSRSDDRMISIVEEVPEKGKPCSTRRTGNLRPCQRPRDHESQLRSVLKSKLIESKVNDGACFALPSHRGVRRNRPISDSDRESCEPRKTAADRHIDEVHFAIDNMFRKEFLLHITRSEDLRPSFSPSARSKKS